MTSGTIRRTFAVAILALQAAAAAHARPFDEVMATKQLRVVTTAASIPHGFMEPASHTLQGVMVDIAQGIGKRLGLEVKLSDVAFSGLIPSLTSGRADMVSAPLFITEERSKVVAFSTPIYGWGEGIVVPENAKKSYAKFEDLKGARVGALIDSVQFKMLKALPGTEIVTYQDYPTLLTDVRVGRIDLGIVDPPGIAYQIRAKVVTGVKLDPAYRPQKPFDVGVAVQKDNPKLLAAVDEALASMRKSGEIDAILKKWGLAGFARP
jgi:polar amino acid transport system substrate-binding protein